MSEKKEKKEKEQKNAAEAEPSRRSRKSRTLTKLFCIRQRYSLKKRVSEMSQLSR